MERPTNQQKPLIPHSVEKSAPSSQIKEYPSYQSFLEIRQPLSNEGARIRGIVRLHFRGEGKKERSDLTQIHNGIKNSSVCLVAKDNELSENSIIQYESCLVHLGEQGTLSIDESQRNILSADVSFWVLEQIGIAAGKDCQIAPIQTSLCISPPLAKNKAQLATYQINNMDEQRLCSGSKGPPALLKIEITLNHDWGVNQQFLQLLESLCITKSPSLDKSYQFERLLCKGGQSVVDLYSMRVRQVNPVLYPSIDPICDKINNQHQICEQIEESRAKWETEKPNKTYFAIKSVRLPKVWNDSLNRQEGIKLTCNELSQILIFGNAAELKLFHKKEQKALDELQTILREIIILRQFKGVKGIIQLKGLYYQEGRSLIKLVFEFAQGGTLFDLMQSINKGYPLDEEMASQIMKKLLTSLTFIHTKDIIHRDLKPANILVITPKSAWSEEQHHQTEVELCIADLGLACHSKISHDLKDEIGTPSYIDPALLNGFQQASTQSDIFSLGSILFNLLSGRLLFPGTHAQNILENNKNLDPIPFVQKYLPKGKISNECEDLLCWMLSMDPSERPTAQECLDHSWFSMGGRVNLASDKGFFTCQQELFPGLMPASK
ncbi:hypothetical protein FGO68_gene2585 [Halteria grandinella]|uniref:Protein kinase domain-containing protein n=1 Tax=Halteria grandinella TaxID=5974 RepID=A0A8J8NFR7_HALGN|nr:hypothetical protein FGO68_gene2585 [Halteria grandinella]